MEEGIQRFLRGRIEEMPRERARLWQRDYRSAKDYEKSVSPHRKRFRRIVGAVDPRVSPCAPELLASPLGPSELAQGCGFNVFALSEHPKAAIREHLKSGHSFRRNVQDIDSSGRVSSLSQHGECLGGSAIRDRGIAALIDGKDGAPAAAAIVSRNNRRFTALSAIVGVDLVLFRSWPRSHNGRCDS
jgi:hypothetical protein